MKETLYEKICRYHRLFEDKDISFLRHLFNYFDIFKIENKEITEITADRLIVFTALKDYENKIKF